MQRYNVRKAAEPVRLFDNWDEGAWRGAEIAKIDNFRPESSPHHPEVHCKFLYTEKGIYGLFQVKDQYVRCVASHFQDNVCYDSCVEFFVQPDCGEGYCNFEFSGGGQFLAYHVTDPTGGPLFLAACRPLDISEVSGIEIYHTLPAFVEPEITEPITWRLGFFLPFYVLTSIFGGKAPQSGSVWRANFYKIADKTSHPHWAAWSPVPEVNYHLPQCFGEFLFL